MGDLEIMCPERPLMADPGWNVVMETGQDGVGVQPLKHSYN